MYPRHKLDTYQENGAKHVFQYHSAMLSIDMGLGKTMITATAIADLFNWGQIRGVLVLAPRRVAELVWKQQIEEWSHTAHLRVCVLRGKSKAQLEADLVRKYDIWVLNYESLPWLGVALNKLFLSRGQMPPFDMLVLDESTRVKNEEGARVATLYARNRQGTRLIDFFHRRVGLTGTLIPNGYLDLFGQFLALDDGAALGNLRRDYESNYFTEDPYTGRKSLQPGAKELIEARISPITFTLRQEDHYKLPDYRFNDIWVTLPPRVRAAYDQFEAEMFAEMDHGTLEVFNRSSVSMKCRQIANGAIKDTAGEVAHDVHDAKLEALDELLDEMGGRPILISYIFRHDMQRIRRRYEKRMPTAYIGPGVSEADALQIYADWNARKYSILLLHHKSGGHGLNLQHGANHAAWFGLDWPLEGWLQLNARLRRREQKESFVLIHRILTRDTVDEAILSRLTERESDQDDLDASLAALQSYRERRR